MCLVFYKIRIYLSTLSHISPPHTCVNLHKIHTHKILSWFLSQTETQSLFIFDTSMIFLKKYNGYAIQRCQVYKSALFIRLCMRLYKCITYHILAKKLLIYKLPLHYFLWTFLVKCQNSLFSILHVTFPNENKFTLSFGELVHIWFKFRKKRINYLGKRIWSILSCLYAFVFLITENSNIKVNLYLFNYFIGRKRVMKCFFFTYVYILTPY